MLTFVDVISGDELFYDTHPPRCTSKLSMENTCMKVESKEPGYNVIRHIQQQIQLRKITGVSKEQFLEQFRLYKQKVVASLIARGLRRRVNAFYRGSNQLIEMIADNLDCVELYAGAERQDGHGFYCMSLKASPSAQP